MSCFLISLGLSEESKVSTPAFTDALRLYRQAKGHYGTWDLMCGNQAQVSEGHSCLEHLTAVTIKHPSYKTGCFAYKMHCSSDGLISNCNLYSIFGEFKVLSIRPREREEERTGQTAFIPVHFCFPWIIRIEFPLNVLNLGFVSQTGGRAPKLCLRCG